MLREGNRAFNYYDRKPGRIKVGSCEMNGGDIWFTFDHDDGSRSILNGARICSEQFARGKGWV